MEAFILFLIAAPFIILGMVIHYKVSDPDFKKKKVLSNYKRELCWFAQGDEDELTELFSKYEATWKVKNKDLFAPQAPTLYRGVVKGSVADQLAEINNRQKIEEYKKKCSDYENDSTYRTIRTSYFSCAEGQISTLKAKMKSIINKYPKNKEAKATLKKYFDLVEDKVSV